MIGSDPEPAQGAHRLITPVPKPRKRKGKQPLLDLGDAAGLSSIEQEYNPTPIINEVRSHVATWRQLPNAADWGVTPTTARLLTHWRSHQFESVRPFFCQIEAVETIVWLTEVARRERRYAKFWEHLKGANEQANPELLRIALKMATGSGKTTVMAMLVAWQTVNAVRSPTSNHFSRGFLKRSAIGFACCCPRIPRVTIARASSCPPTCLATWARRRSSSRTITRSSGARHLTSLRWAAPFFRAGVKRCRRSRAKVRCCSAPAASSWR